MSTVNVTSAQLGPALQQLLMCDQIVPGADVSYQICKTIYAYHPLGKKMADTPIVLAQSQKRIISVTNAPEDRVRDRFLQTWEEMGIDVVIAQLGSTARIYGVGALAMVVKDLEPEAEIPLDKLSDLEIGFNVLDPLNAAGSLVLNQDPNAFDFQKPTVVTAAGKPYHRGRTVVLMNERPIYIEYTTSAFGYVGRSVYQRALFPLKSFVNTMVADDMVARKLGLLIAKLKAPGSIIDNAMKAMAGIKRQLLKEAETNNVLSVDITEGIETLNMQNVDGAGTYSRTNILKNIATAADMPAKMLENETMVSGFGEGTEDAKNNARYVETIRAWLNPVYSFFDPIVMRRAWTEDFFKVMQAEFPDQYGSVSFNEAFYRWKNSFKAEWPSLLKDPESDAKLEEARQKSVLGMLEMLLPQLDSENRARTIQWATDTIGENTLLFPQPLVLDYEQLVNYTPPASAESELPEPKRPELPEPKKPELS